MQHTKLFIAGILILSASCQQMELIEPPQVDERYELNIQGVINQEYVTRANDEGFIDGDRMGVFVVDYENGLPGKLQTENNRANNMCYTYNEENGTWKGAGSIYWRDKTTPVDVYGYYPFVNVVSSIENYEFEVKDNQNKKAEGGEMSSYEASDFLWAKTSGAEFGRPITLTYGHLMAGVQVILQKGEGFTDAEWSKLPKVVSVDNTLRKAVVNLEKGTVAADGAYDQNVILSDEGTSYRGVVVPQTVEAGKSIIGVTIDGVSYSLKKDFLMTYVSGKLHTFTVTVDKRTPSGDYQLSITDEQVAAWENDKSSHSFEGKAYVVVHVEKEGSLKECLQNAGVDVASVKNLKITGRLTESDFDFFQEEMSHIRAINLSEVKILRVQPRSYGSTNSYMDNVLPAYAFYGMPLLESVVLPKSITGIGSYSFEGVHLNSTLVLPESVTTLYEYAFSYLKYAEVVFPNNLEYIETSALSMNGGGKLFGCLKFSNSIKYIGHHAFYNTPNLDVLFAVPSDLEYLGADAFFYSNWRVTGDIVIPNNMTAIPMGAFSGLTFVNGTNLYLHDNVSVISDGAFDSIIINNTLLFPESLTHIGDNAFSNVNFRGGVILSDNLMYIGPCAFENSTMSGNLVIPDNILVVSQNSFANTEIESLTIGNNVESIASGAFCSCGKLRTVKVGENIEYIGDEAFAHCKALQLVRCTSTTPPLCGNFVFDGLDFNHIILEVPEESVELYRLADGWSDFKYITAYRELASGISELEALNKGVIRETVVRSEGPWEIVSCPDWCSVYPMSADTKENISITVRELPFGSGDREGQIVFKLKDKDYTTYTTVRQFDCQYSEDEEILLQEASVGAEEIPIIVIGDGFSSEDIIDDSYLRVMNEQIEYFFNIEPYRTYRDYFTVSTAVVYSPEKGIGNVMATKENRFSTVDDNGVFRCDIDELKGYIKNVFARVNDDNLKKTLVILMVNSRRFGGNVYIEEDGTTICFCPLSDDSYPYDQRGVIQHFAGGRGFGKLAQEDVYHYDFMSLCSCPGCNKTNEYHWAKSHGWYDNVSLSSKMNDVPWSHLIFHPKYSHLVDVYEGGLGHARGVFRSEINSCMNTYIPYYNTICRESIVRRIMEYAGKEYSFEDFIANDKIEIPE